MFFHLFKYKVKALLHTKDALLWNMLFPIALATLFFAAFGNMMDGKENKLSPIPVAIVTVEENQPLTQTIDSLSEENEDQLFIATKTDESKALDMLDNKDIDGIIYVKDTPTVFVKESGMNQTIIQSFLNQFMTQSDVLKDVVKNHPEQINNAIASLSKDVRFNKEVSLTNSTYDPFLQYFYALIAMACLFGSSTGVQCVLQLQANISNLGMRREASPQHKMTAIISDFLATVLIQCFNVFLLFFYLIVILGIDFGERMPLSFLTGIVGTIIGVALGMLIAAVVKGTAHTKSAAASSISMALCFCSGLVVSNMQDIIEHYVPFFNRINPAALITDCLYSLNMYESYTRFTRGICSMLVIAGIFCFLSYLLLRRNKYANL